jgi:hypothetical protein
MGASWPPPHEDDTRYGRGPNYRMRRTIVAVGALAVLAAVGGGLWVAVGGGDDEAGPGAMEATDWNTVVIQRPDGSITLVGGADELASDDGVDEVDVATTSLRGVIDVGLSGSVVVGTSGSPSKDGLGVVDLDSGEITELGVGFDGVRRLAGSSYLVSYDAAGGGLELIDAATATVIDLLALVDGDDPLAAPESVRVDPETGHVAFTELRRFETVVVDVANETGQALPGALVDLAFGRVLTVTNRGDTVLLDLSATDGTRIGTAEVAPIAAAMIVDEATAIAVAADGAVSRVTFADGDGSVEELPTLAGQLPTPPGSSSGEDAAVVDDLVAGGLVANNHQRLVVFGDRFVAAVDATGGLAGSVDVAEQLDPFLDPDPFDRCITVGTVGGPFTVVDTDTASIVTAFDDGSLINASQDGCVVVFRESTTSSRGDHIAGIGVDRRTNEPVIALAADGSAAIFGSTSGTMLLDLTSGNTVQLTTDRATAAFTTR